MCVHAVSRRLIRSQTLLGAAPGAAGILVRLRGCSCYRKRKKDSFSKILLIISTNITDINSRLPATVKYISMIDYLQFLF